MPYPAVNHFFSSPPPEDVGPPPGSLEGPFAPNERLHEAIRLFSGRVQGAESVAVSANGSLALLDKFGQLWTTKPPVKPHQKGGDSSVYWLSPQPVARLGNGRPLGSKFDRKGNLIVCDTVKGLLKLDKDDPQSITILAAAVSDDSPLAPGAVINYANDLDIASDGKVYFSASQDILPTLSADGFWDTLNSYVLGACSGQKRGKLLVYDPATKKTHALAIDLYFANGVALSADESYVLVVETHQRRVTRFWLKGPKTGSRDVFVEGLPSFPDGLSRAADGGFWLPLVAPFSPLFKLLPSRAFAAFVSWVPVRQWLTVLGPWNPTAIKPWGFVVKLSPDGAVTETLQDPDGSHVSFVSAVEEHGGRLWLGNLVGNYVSYLDL